MSQQEIIPPNRESRAVTARKELELIDHSISELRSKMNFVDRIRASFRAGETAANLLAAMQGDVLKAQRDVIQHHAQMIARERKMQITDAYQAGIADLTRRVDERVSAETKYYWNKLYERLDYYEDFFQRKIEEYRQKGESGAMPKDRADARVRQCEADRDAQLKNDHVLIGELQKANERAVQRALEEYQPS
jgi:hypothetical protein